MAALCIGIRRSLLRNTWLVNLLLTHLYMLDAVSRLFGYFIVLLVTGFMRRRKYYCIVISSTSGLLCARIYHTFRMINKAFRIK